MPKLISMLSMSDYTITAFKKIIVILSGLLSASLLARYLGPELRADYAIVVNASAILVLILNFGISNSYQSSRRKLGYQVAKSYCLYSVLLFCVIFVVGLFAVLFFEGQYSFVLIVVSLSLLRLQLQSFSLIENLRGASLASILGSLGELLVLIALWCFAPAFLLWGLLAVLLKDFIIAAVSYYVIYRTSWPQISRENSVKNNFGFGETSFLTKSRGVFLKSFPLFLLTVLIGINYKIDVLFLDLLGVKKNLIGIFSIGVVAAEYLWIFSDIFKDVQISRTARGGQASEVAFATRAAIGVTLIVYLLFLLFGDFAISIFFGYEYLDSFSVARLMLIANLFMIPCKIIGTYYISIERIKIYLMSMLLAVFVNIALNLILIPIYGFYGAVFSSISSYAIAGSIMLIDFIKFSGMSLYKTIIIGPQEILVLFKKFRGCN